MPPKAFTAHSPPTGGHDNGRHFQQFRGHQVAEPVLAGVRPAHRPRNTNVVRAFKEGWGGVVWKTPWGGDPPVVNVNGPRYGAIWGADRRVLGFNNIELITDRELQTNLREIKRVKKDWPDRAVVVSLMVPCEEENWKSILRLVEETDADGIELNFRLPATA